MARKRPGVRLDPERYKGTPDAYDVATVLADQIEREREDRNSGGDIADDMPWYEIAITGGSVVVAAMTLKMSPAKVAEVVYTKLNPPNGDAYFWMARHFSRTEQLAEISGRAKELHRLAGDLRDCVDGGGVAPTPVAPPSKPVSRSQAHNNRVLEALRQCGYDPLSLPPYPNGRKSPAKQAAKTICLNMSRDVFDKAWDRLLQDGMIAYA